MSEFNLFYGIDDFNDNKDNYFVSNFKEYRTREIKVHNSYKTELMSELLQKFGVVQPILINKNNFVIDGAFRLKILNDLGITTDNITVLDVTDEDALILRLMLFNSSRYSSFWDKTIFEINKDDNTILPRAGFQIPDDFVISQKKAEDKFNSEFFDQGD